MAQNILHIKNMVCDRCIMAVQKILRDLDLHYSNIQLGTVTLVKEIADKERDLLADRLQLLGFELLQTRKSVLTEKIKNIIIQQIQYTQDNLTVNISTYLSEKLHVDYSLLSNTFSEMEGVTIEQFTILQKIEKVKELLSYGEKTLTEIAYEMGYTSVAYLSAQFKKQTGQSPSQYKKNNTIPRKALDKVKAG